MAMKLIQGDAGTYRHVKTGDRYRIVVLNAKLEHDLSPVVVYRNIETGEVRVISRDEFTDGRFELMADE